MTLIAIRCQKSVNQITDYVSPVGLSSAYYNNDHFQKKIGIVSVKSKKKYYEITLLALFGYSCS
jgi:hypothetical protein